MSRRLASLLPVAALLAACGLEPVAAPQHAAIPRGKAGAPVTVTLAEAPELYAGVPARLSLVIRPGIAVDSVLLQVDGDEALDVTGWQPRQLPALKAGEAAEVAVELVAQSGGQRRLAVLVRLQVQGQQQARAVTLPLKAGGPVSVISRKPEITAQQTPEGQRIHSLPAETTVR